MNFRETAPVLSALLRKGVSLGAYPCFAASAGAGEDVAYFEHYGHRSLYPKEKYLTEDTLFDMASLSKLIGTTMACLRMVEEGKINIEDNIGKYIENCYGKDYITIFRLMTHTSGLPAHLPLYKEPDPTRVTEYILSPDLFYETGSKTVYSCMGYILLGKILESIEKKPLDEIVKEKVFIPLEMNHSFYNPPKGIPCASTEKDIFTGEIINGVVHDENARFLGGVAGNAGTFCTLADATRFARMLSLRGRGYLSASLFEYAVTDHTPSLSESRGLGFQLYTGKPFPAGNKMHYGSYGHTGFTGTSLYVDNSTGVYGVLLTNRVHPTRENNMLSIFRRDFYNTLFSEE